VLEKIKLKRIVDARNFIAMTNSFRHPKERKKNESANKARKVSTEIVTGLPYLI